MTKPDEIASFSQFSVVSHMFWMPTSTFKKKRTLNGHFCRPAETDPYMQACSTFEVHSDSNARVGSSRILTHVRRGRYLKITSEKPYCKYNASDLCWNAELPQVSFFYIWEPVIVSKPGWASICALSTLLFLVCGPKKLLELPGIYGKSGDRRSNCIFILDCSPQPCWPCSLALAPRFHKGRVVVQQCTL